MAPLLLRTGATLIASGLVLQALSLALRAGGWARLIAFLYLLLGMIQAGCFIIAHLMAGLAPRRPMAVLMSITAVLWWLALWPADLILAAPKLRRVRIGADSVALRSGPWDR